MKLRQRLSTLGSTIGLLATLAAPASAGVLRIDGMENRTTVDVREGTTLTPEDSPITLTTFGRAKIHHDYSGNTTYGGFIDLNLKAAEGINLTVEGTSATGTEPGINIGPQFAGDVPGIGYVFAFPSVKVSTETYPVGLIFNIDRTFSIGDIDLVGRLETGTAWDRTTGIKPSAANQALRIGIPFGNYVIGPAANFTQQEGSKPDQQFGGYLRFTF